MSRCRTLDEDGRTEGWMLCMMDMRFCGISDGVGREVGISFCAVKSLFLGRTLWIQRIRYQHDIDFQYLYPAMPLQLLANQNAALIQSSFNQERKRLALFLLRGLALGLALC